MVQSSHFRKWETVATTRKYKFALEIRDLLVKIRGGMHRVEPAALIDDKDYWISELQLTPCDEL